MGALEISTKENKEYLQRLIELMTKGAEEVNTPSPEEERHVKRPEEPSVFASKLALVVDEQKESAWDAQKFKIGGKTLELGEASYLKEAHAWERNSGNMQGSCLPRPKIELQTFDGINLRGWKTSVDEYQEIFEELTPYMLLQNSYLEEDYFISNFVSGLKDELKHRVKVHKLKSLAVASTTSIVKNSQNPPNNRQALLDYRIAHNLCFKGWEKFMPGHQCKVKQLNLMEEEEEHEENELVEEETEGEEETEVTNQGSGNLEISMNTLTGNIGCNTSRIPGTIKGKILSILMDSGSTHGVITLSWAKEGIEVVQTHLVAITVANGEKLYNNAKSNQLTWRMEGKWFEHDFRVLNMGGVT
ncbi:hypothetical protein GQ457_06G014560 [Hibiscus cannabinus]